MKAHSVVTEVVGDIEAAVSRQLRDAVKAANTRLQSFVGHKVTVPLNRSYGHTATIDVETVTTTLSSRRHNSEVYLVARFNNDPQYDTWVEIVLY